MENFVYIWYLSLQHPCLGNPTDRGALVHGVTRVGHNLVLTSELLKGFA